MQAQRTQVPSRPMAARASALPLSATVLPAVGSVTGALRVVEAILLRGGQRTARRNAWAAVLEDRRRAQDRSEAQHVLDTLAHGGTPAHGAAAGSDHRGAPLAATAPATGRTAGAEEV